MADVEHIPKQFNSVQDNSMLSSLFKVLEVEHWGSKRDDYVTVLRHWSRKMGGEARSRLVYHLKRIGLPLLGQK